MTYSDETPPLIASYMGLHCSLISLISLWVLLGIGVEQICINFVDLLCNTENANHPTHFPDVRLHRGSYMSAHVLLNLLNELGKRDKMWGLPSILSIFRNEFNKFNNTRARMSDSIYHMTNTLKSHFWRKNVIHLSVCTQRCYGRHNVSRKSINH